VWESDPYVGSPEKALSEANGEHYIAQAEQYEDWEGIVTSFRQWYPDMSAAVVTTFWGLGAGPSGYDKEMCRPVIEAGFHCLTEAYVNQSSPSVSPERLDATARFLGWPNTQPVIGVYWDFPAKEYIDKYKLADYPGYWVWLAETMRPEDWDALSEFNRR
jgi:hypothetical protein